MKNLQDLRQERIDIEKKYKEELRTNQEKMLSKIFSDLKILTGLEFTIQAIYVNEILIGGGNLEEENCIFISLSKEEYLDLLDVSDESENQIYESAIYFYFQSGGILPNYFLRIVKENQKLKEENNKLHKIEKEKKYQVSYEKVLKNLLWLEEVFYDLDKNEKLSEKTFREIQTYIKERA
ncbi:MAG: hypothetical protein ACOCRX_10800 [Candidatus Woesearchaeota archaeon]